MQPHVDSMRVKCGKTLELCILRTVRRINIVEVVLDVLCPIEHRETGFSGGGGGGKNQR